MSGRLGTLEITANRLKVARMQKGWTMRELARQSGVSSATVCRVESGRDPNLRDALMLAQTVGYAVEELWEVSR